jgi:ankyrin repeat protein
VASETGQTPIAAIHDEPEMLRALVEAGADLDRVQPNGVTALVHFIATRQWESALYLIGKGASLDVRNADGLSVDYYLNEWKESVFGDHPEGWDQVRDAIRARRVRK